jgi:hypothetical protein
MVTDLLSNRNNVPSTSNKKTNSLAAKHHRRVTSFDVKCNDGGSAAAHHSYYDDQLRNKEHLSLIQSRNFVPGVTETGGEILSSEMRSTNSASLRMSMMNTKLMQPTNNAVASGGNLRNNKSISI